MEKLKRQAKEAAPGRVAPRLNPSSNIPIVLRFKDETVKKIYDALVGEGMPLECLSRIHAPIGLDIGAVSPEEIAISILAELIAVRRGRIDEPHVASASLQWKKLPASLAKE